MQTAVSAQAKSQQRSKGPQEVSSYGYLPIPSRLADDLQDSLSALGVYALIARLYLIYQQPIPVSTPDLQRYDPQISRGAAIRALQRLTRGGWLIEGPKQAGHKSTYAPAWGMIAGTPRPWAMAAPALGRPRHIRIVRLDHRLLDTCIGKFTPHQRHAAQVERYVTDPMLTLADIGSYLLSLTGHQTETERLIRYNLAGKHGVNPLPSDQELLARASQQSLYDHSQTVITPKGLQKLGVQLLPRKTAPGQLLFLCHRL